MLTKEALINNLDVRNYLLMKMYLCGHLHPKYLKYIFRWSRNKSKKDMPYDKLLKWERRISRIEDKV